MTARAEATRATGETILDAAWDAFRQQPFDLVTLNEVASRSGVTVQTVIRRFGSKAQLFEAVAEREGDRIRASRDVPASAGLPAALDALIDHYETDGDVVLHLLAQEQRAASVAEAVQQGRRVHHDWVERHCREVFSGTRGKERERLIHAAIVATDLGTWKLLRRDLSLERAEVTAIMLGLVNGLKETT
jgi:AcrR family transcriptional regulator